MKNYIRNIYLTKLKFDCWQKKTLLKNVFVNVCGYHLIGNKSVKDNEHIMDHTAWWDHLQSQTTDVPGHSWHVWQPDKMEFGSNLCRLECWLWYQFCKTRKEKKQSQGSEELSVKILISTIFLVLYDLFGTHCKSLRHLRFKLFIQKIIKGEKSKHFS